ncbi:uncharacterized protein LOC125053108 [Pieris napi]|uniref:uncharacterized protein LOC125053108 n=1 Tax=Pieris napi TaxID=78633 RepID=UPI001FBB1DEE|nr:uncharacterized protein LOC125053108 [Pieris napi]
MALVYSCCFWFSLRLGGLLISFLSILQAVLFLIIFSLFSVQDYELKCDKLKVLDDINLIYMKSFITGIIEGKFTYYYLPQKVNRKNNSFDKYFFLESNYDTYIKTILCLYIMACVIYIYGAFKLVNILMFPYIFLELLRLIGLSFFGITGLLVLKKNTMDIGLLIGISLVVGFTLLGMFYLWICAMNLPIVINEIKANEQAALLGTFKNKVGKHTVRNNLLFSEYRNLGASQIFMQTTRQNRFSTSDEPPRYYY